MGAMGKGSIPSRAGQCWMAAFTGRTRSTRRAWRRAHRVESGRVVAQRLCTQRFGTNPPMGVACAHGDHHETAIDTPNGDHQRSNSNPSTPKATLPSIIPTTVHAMAALDREGTKIDRVPQCRHRKRRMRNCALRNDSGWVQLGQEKDTMSSAYFHPGCTRQTMEPTTGSLHRMR